MGDRFPIILVSILALAGTCLAAERIGVIAIGMVVPGSSPIPAWMSIEPGTSTILVPNRYAIGVFEDREARRVVRIYFPRTPETLSDSDVLVFSGGNIRGFELPQIEMMKAAVSEGMGGLTDIGGLSSDPGVSGDWLASGIDEIFPNDVDAVTFGGQSYRDEMYFRIRIAESTRPVLSMFGPLGIEDVVGKNAYRMVPREGSTTWASTTGNWPGVRPRPPWLLSWEFGEGLTWAIADAFTFEFWSNYQSVISGRGHETTNRYGLDILMNLLLESVGRPLPNDVLLVHEVRTNLRLYRDTRSMMFEVLNFLEQFGANTDELSHRIAEIEEIRKSAEDLYLSQDFEASNEEILEALAQSGEIGEGVEELRNSAMLWIFVTEWSIVSATLMISGTAVYRLMAKRELYREVGVTREGET